MLSGPILWLAGVQDVSSAMRGPALIVAVIAFLAGAVVHILDQICKLREQIRQHDAAMITKINESVGDVYDAGKKSKERHQALDATSGVALAVVRDLSPR